MLRLCLLLRARALGLFGGHGAWFDELLERPRGCAQRLAALLEALAAHPSDRRAYQQAPWLGPALAPDGVIESLRSTRIHDAEVRQALSLLTSYSWNCGPALRTVTSGPEALCCARQEAASRRAVGGYYTDHEVCAYILDHALSEWLAHRMGAPQLGTQVPWSRARLRRWLSPSATRRRTCAELIRMVRILDPAVGTGRFLRVALRLLVDWLRWLEGATPGEADVRRIAVDQLHGIDLDPWVVETCSVLLWMDMLPHVRRERDGPLLPDLSQSLRTGDALDPASPGVGETHDVIVGNPPYVEVCPSSTIGNHSRGCGNLAGHILERALDLSKEGSSLGFVLPVSVLASERAAGLRAYLRHECSLWVSSFSNRPARLFEGVEQRHAILLGLRDRNPQRRYHSAAYRHWYANERRDLLPEIRYVAVADAVSPDILAKIGSPVHRLIIERLGLAPGLPLEAMRGPWPLYVHDGPTYWVRALPFPPNRGSSRPISSHYRRLDLESEQLRDYIVAVLSSSLFYLHYKTYSNCRDLTLGDIGRFPFRSVDPEVARLGRELGEAYARTGRVRQRRYPSGLVEYDEYYPALCIDTIHRIDRAVARQYGLSDEERRFVMNHDRRYRLARRAEP